MAIRALNPTTPAQRGMTSQDTAGITANKPRRGLVVSRKSASGRNSSGRITVRHRGGGARRSYRLINFKLPVGIEARVEQIEYEDRKSVV